MKLPSITRHKYTYTVLVFLVWVLFFDANNMVYQWKLSGRLNKLKDQEAFYKTEMKKDSISVFHLTSNLDNLEKFGREHYLMKKDNEDIFLIVREQ